MVAAQRQRQRQRWWRKRDSATSAVVAARQRDVGGSLAVARRRRQHQRRWRQRDAGGSAIAAARMLRRWRQCDVGGSLAVGWRWRQRNAWRWRTARWRPVRWQQHGGCGGFTGTVRKCANARAFEHHQRADVCVFVLGRGWRDDSADGIVIVGSDGGARGDVHRGRRCTAAAADDADGNTNDIVC